MTGAIRQTKENVNSAVRVDDTSTADTVYIGLAPVGSLETLAVWQIKKVATASGMIITWADGDAEFNNIWDNRLSLTYL